MTELLGALALLATAALLGALLGSLAALPAARLGLTERLAPRLRCRRAGLIAALPVAGAVLGIAALLLPALLKLVGVIDDHCLAHGLHHPHFCLRHRPAFAASGLILALLVPAAMAAARLTVRIAHGARQVRMTAGIARVAGSPGAVITTALATPSAFVFGLGRMRIVVSDGLRQLLEPAERRAVLRHEIAHARAGDPTRGLILDLLLALHGPGTERRLRRYWRQAAEERADDAVAARGQGLDLAAALVKLARCRTRPEASDRLVPAVDAGNLRRRIRRLADGGNDAQISPWFERGAGLAVLAALVLAVSAHHFLETLLGWL